MDGVITSEQNYWNAAALTVYEMLNSSKYLGEKEINSAISLEEIKKIRSEVLVDDQLISLLKDRGVNTNWDLAFVVLTVALILQFEEGASDFSEIFQYLAIRELDGYELYTYIQQKLSKISFRDENYYIRHGELWNTCQQVFQEWYLGDNTYIKTYDQEPKQPGKKGLMYSEEPIIPVEELRETLSILQNEGFQMGIGTGRPFVEIHTPLKAWDIEKYFDYNAYITYTEVETAEEKLEGTNEKVSLAKPHPYVFLKAIYGKSYPDKQLLCGHYDKKMIKKTLIIGDAGSDIMAAQAIPCKFAAVLTGVSGERAREYFEKMNADYILDSIRALVE